MRIIRKSEYMVQVMREIRQAALKEKNDEARSRLWRWYYRLLHGEDEIQLMLKDTAMRNVLEYIIEYGLLPVNWQGEFAKLEAKLRAEIGEPPPPIDDIDDDHIPPCQMRLFDD